MKEHMTNEEFRELRTLIKDQMVEIKALAIAVRALDRRLTSIESSLIRPSDVEYEVLGTEPFDELLRIRQSLAPHSDNE
jgi:hypothetical protein